MTMMIDEVNRRVYMAGLSLAQFIGYESTMDFCGHTVLIVADINADEILYFSTADCGAGKIAENAAGALPQKWSAYWQAAVSSYVPAEYQPQVERFYSGRYIMNLYARGGRLDSMEYPCIVGGKTHWVRTTYQLEPMETGHIQATAAVIDISRYRDREQQLTKKATHDGLTGLINRTAAQEQITAALAQDPDGPAAIAVLDIDSFKQTNDRYGHECGDRVLLNFADELQAYFASDVLISRTGGDEFLLYLPHTTQEEAEQILGDFAEKEHFGFTYGSCGCKETDGKAEDAHDFYFYTSVGYCMFPAQGRDYEHLSALADEAMYAAKVSPGTHHMQYDKAAMPAHRSGLGFSLRDLAGSIPAAVLVYQAYGEEKILFANEALIELFECENLDDFMAYTGGRIGGVVLEEDAAQAERQLRMQLAREESRDHGYCRYRIRTKTGRIRHVEDYGRLVSTEHHGNVFYAVLHDEEERDRLIAMAE